MKSFTHEKKLEHQFDSYCKKVLRNFARDIYAAEKFKNSLFVSLDTLTEEQLAEFSISDEYSSDYYNFSTNEDDVHIKDFMLPKQLRPYVNKSKILFCFLIFST